MNLNIKSRLLILFLLVSFVLVYILKLNQEKITSIFEPKSEKACILEQQQQQQQSQDIERSAKYLNLNIKNEKEHILLLTTISTKHHNLSDIEKYLDNYLNLIDTTSYANKLITISFLVDQNKKLFDLTTRYVNKYQSRWRNQFYQFNVFQKNIHQSSRAKNYLLSLSLREHHEWVFWLDLNLYSFNKDIFKHLISLDQDVVVPNCLMKRDNPQEYWAYERNNWAESDLSLLSQINEPEDRLLSEDALEYSLGRHLLVDMPTHLGLDYKVPLDGVGSSFIMVRSTVHRQGAIFPPFIYQHQKDTEGFAKIVKSMGFSIYGVPGYTIYHF